MRLTRCRLISPANIGPNLFHQSRTVSWQMSIPRSHSRSSTFLRVSGKYLPETGQLIVYSGEVKLHADVGSAIRSAVASISSALQPDKLDHELHLVRRDLDLSGLDGRGSAELLRFLDPLEPRSANRIDAVTRLLGYDFAGYSGLTPATADDVFRERARTQLEKSAADFASALRKAGLEHRPIELFLLLLPSVEQLRKSFQARIGGVAG